MKKSLLIFLVLATASPAFPQNKKGTLLIGTYLGSGGFSSRSSESSNSRSSAINKSDSSSLNIGVGPNIGYFIKDNIVVGTYFGLSYYSGKSDSSNTVSTATSESSYNRIYLSLGPFARYYLGKSTKGVPYIQINVGTNLYPKYHSEYSSSTGYGYESKYKKRSTFNAGIQIGYENFLNSAIGLQYYAGYSYSRYKYTIEYDYTAGSDYTSNYKNSSNGFSFGVGLQIHLDWLIKN